MPTNSNRQVNEREEEKKKINNKFDMVCESLNVLQVETTDIGVTLTYGKCIEGRTGIAEIVRTYGKLRIFFFFSDIRKQYRLLFGIISIVFTRRTHSAGQQQQ